jgi:putative ATP-binding cassette transporter
MTERKTHVPGSRPRIFLSATAMLWRFLRSPSPGSTGKLLFVCLILLLMSNNGLNVLISYVGRAFMNAIEQKDLEEFHHQAMVMLGVFLVAAGSGAWTRYCEETLGMHWRMWMTRNALNHYMTHHTYHFIETTGQLQHPDQRISEDIRVLTTTALSMFIMGVNALLAIAAFSGVLWSISPQLLGVAVGYAALGSLVTYLVGRTLIPLNSRQLDLEADFRSDLLHVSQNSEAIALQRQEMPMLHRLRGRVLSLLTNLTKVFGINRQLTLFSGTYGYLIQLIPALFVAPLFIEGKTDFGVISQALLAFTIIVNAFSLMVSQFPTVSTLAAVSNRLKDLSLAHEQANAGGLESLDIQVGSRAIVYDHVTIQAREREPALVKDLCLTIARGQRTLFHSRNKAALQRLFNVTAGLEDHSHGILHQPAPHGVLFLPEKPYIPPGSLRQALSAPGLKALLPDDRLQRRLADLGLAHLVDVCGGPDQSHMDWNQLLSLAEQKLVNIIRLLETSPAFAFLFQVRSVLTEEQYGTVMNLLGDSTITYVQMDTMGIPAHYDCSVEILDGGHWVIDRAPTLTTTSQRPD